MLKIFNREGYQELQKKYRELEGRGNRQEKKLISSEQSQQEYAILLKKAELDQIVEMNVKKRVAKEKWKEKYEELKMENKKLGEETAREKKEWKEKYEKLEQENIKLKKENQIFKETEGKYRSCLIGHFLELQEMLWRIDEEDKAYEDFFNDSVLPLQILIGLDREMESQTEERIDYYIWDVIIEPLTGVMKKRGGELQNGKIVLPKQGKKFEKEEILKKIEQESFDQIERYLKEDERRAELKKIVLQKKQVVEDLGRMLEELEELQTVHKISKKEIGRLAKEVRILLERNGIYPMFAEELKEYSNSELRNRMIPINSNSIRYPGLFIKRDGKLEVFGTNIGMDS